MSEDKQTRRYGMVCVRGRSGKLNMSDSGDQKILCTSISFLYSIYVYDRAVPGASSFHRNACSSANDGRLMPFHFSSLCYDYCFNLRVACMHVSVISSTASSLWFAFLMQTV